MKITDKDVNEILLKTIIEVMRTNSCDIHDAVELVSRSTKRSEKYLLEIYDSQWAEDPYY